MVVMKLHLSFSVHLMMVLAVFGTPAIQLLILACTCQTLRTVNVVSHEGALYFFTRVIVTIKSLSCFSSCVSNLDCWRKLFQILTFAWRAWWLTIVYCNVCSRQRGHSASASSYTTEPPNFVLCIQRRWQHFCYWEFRQASQSKCKHEVIWSVIFNFVLSISRDVYDSRNFGDPQFSYKNLIWNI